VKEHVGCGCFPTGRHYPGIAHLLRVRARGVVTDLDGDSRWNELPIAVIDTETTGRDPQTGDRIVEIGIVVGLRGEIVKQWNWLVNPERPIPDEAREVHGISDDDVKDKPTFKEIAAEVALALKGCIPVAYNAKFDRDFVAAELAKSGLVHEAFPPCLRTECEWIDPLVWARELQKYEKGKKLGEVAQRLGIAIENAHRASDDARAALEILYVFARDPRVPQTYAALVQEQRRLSRAQDDDFRAWRQRNPRP
jgi:DNA polymerase-3 subunit epsilon